jgi:hypothetical protein
MKPQVILPSTDRATLLPAYEDIPQTFKLARSPWCELVAIWYERGLGGSFVAKKGIDGPSALQHINALMRADLPHVKHVHKMAGMAFLMSLWFERFEPTPTVRATA